GAVWNLDVARSRLSFPLDPDLRFDLRFSRFLDNAEALVRRFQPDYIHLTSPGDLGILGSIVAGRIGVPLAASWHTNLHEFAARRFSRICTWLPSGVRDRSANFVERFVLDRVCWFFGRAQVLFAPNPELATLLRSRTGRRVAIMGRGI